MKSYLKTALVLALICAGSAVTLATINGKTAPVIAAYEQQKTTDALKAVAHGYEIGEKIELQESTSPYYIPLTENGEIKGYLLELAGNGYGGKLTLVASYDLEGKVLEAQVVSNSETPGLGKKSEESWYMNKYKNKKVIPTKKSQLSDEDSSAVSGASITFAAVGKALSKGSEVVKNLGVK